MLMRALISRTHRRGIWAAVALGALASASVWRLKPQANVLPLVATIGNRGAEIYPLLFSPDGQTLVTLDDEGNVTLWEIASGKAQATIKPNEGTTKRLLDVNLVFSPDGAWIAIPSVLPPASRFVDIHNTRTGARVHRINVNESREPFLLHSWFADEGTSFRQLEWNFEANPDSSETPSGFERSWDTATWTEQTPRPLRVRLASRMGRLGIASDHRNVAVDRRGARSIVLLDLLADREIGELFRDSPIQQAPVAIQWSPDRSRLLIAHWDSTLELWDVPAKRPISTMRGHTKDFIPSYLTFSSDGSTVASFGIFWDHRNQLSGRVGQVFWGLASLAQRKPPPPPDYPTDVILWDPATGQIRFSLPGHGRPAFSPDGKILATADNAGHVNLWRLPEVGAGAGAGPSLRPVHSKPLASGLSSTRSAVGRAGEPARLP
jgi:WD40 repeat protein